MQKKVKLKEVISVVKLSLFLIWCWPPPQDATKFKMLCVKLHHCLSIILSIGLVAPLMYAIKNHLDDPPILTRLIIMTGSVLHTTCNFIFHRVNCHHIQNVTFEMVHFSSLMKPHEEIVIQQYINTCVMFYSTSMFISYFVAIASIAIIPFITEQTFPTLAEYPFDVSYQPLKTIIFVQQSTVGLMVAGQLCANTFMALLLWFATARFEILTEELRKVTNVCELFKCIKKHQELFKYAKEVIIAVRPFAFITICWSTISVISSFLLLITNQPIAIIAQFSVLVLTALLGVFMYTWPAEYLMHSSKNIAYATFNMLEDNHFIEIWKCLQVIIMRSQKPLKVTIPCLMPALSFNYFTAYLSTILSYFTTLRVLMDDDKN